MTAFSVCSAFGYTKARRERGYTARPYTETIHDKTAWLKAEGLT